MVLTRNQLKNLPTLPEPPLPQPVSIMAYNLFNLYYNDIILVNEGVTNKTAVSLVTEDQKGCPKDQIFDGDVKTTQLFLDYLDECAVDFDWNRIWIITDSKGAKNDIILQHVKISMDDLKKHIDDTYWTAIKDKTKTAATDAEVQMQLCADIMYECIKN